MKIHNATYQDTKSFIVISQGDVFEFDENLYMKTEPDANSNCINLDTGEIRNLQQKTKVIHHLKATVVVNGVESIQ